MTATVSSPDDRIHLSWTKTRRDFDVSLALVIAGIVLEVVYYWLTPWVASSGASALTAWTILIAGGVGYVLILVGAIFTGVNWSLLRKANKTV